MEHGLILLIEAILAIDRKLQKPLREVVPELPRLRADPRAVLGEGEVVLGPRRAYAVAGVLGMLAGVVVLVGFVVSALDRPRNQPVEPWYFAAAGVCVVVTAAAGAALMLHWLRGGSAVLREEGVEFIYRGRSAFAPWALFQAPGSPYQPDHKRLILPANDLTPVAEGDYEGNVTARPAAEVKTPPLAGCADGQVVLADLYEVRLPELGELLLHLGRQLGDAPDGPDAAGGLVTVAHVPLATPEKGGWLRVRLTRLPFPPVCSGCGGATAEAVQHTLDAGHAVQIDVPLCGPCQADRRRARTRALLIGLGAGLIPVVLWVLAAGPFLDGIDLCVGVGILLPVGLFAGLIGGLLARDRADPARFRDYSASSGTVAMRLRPTPGAAAFRRALGVADEPEPAGVG
jgi:hypothetical protein